MTDKDIVYFIMSHTVELTPGGKKDFQWPCMPDPEMGDEFIRKIKDQFYEIKLWIKFNPERYQQAINGYYQIN